MPATHWALSEDLHGDDGLGKLTWQKGMLLIRVGTSMHVLVNIPLSDSESPSLLSPSDGTV